MPQAAEMQMAACFVRPDRTVILLIETCRLEMRIDKTCGPATN